ncbi:MULTISPECIES: hypothetical protein [Nostocales]|uniref:Uncharacterized protein n=3 Tax=Nostocales TaxID=1161 RepID=A0A8S9SZC9_9CYAN|nr:hypothetical protein [Tolypothrix bouteillei]KAF3885196.1 hypothetical protein DA73_0400006775 [Tolypothrix bouteillei VB521301]
MAHLITSDREAIEIAKQMVWELVRGSVDRDRKLPCTELESFWKAGFLNWKNLI